MVEAGGIEPPSLEPSRRVSTCVSPEPSLVRFRPLARRVVRGVFSEPQALVSPSVSLFWLRSFRDAEAMLPKRTPWSDQGNDLFGRCRAFGPDGLKVVDAIHFGVYSVDGFLTRPTDQPRHATTTFRIQVETLAPPDRSPINHTTFFSTVLY